MLKQLALVVVMCCSSVYAQTCGVEPVSRPAPPAGCKDLVARCYCDDHNNCHWTWECVPDDDVAVCTRPTSYQPTWSEVGALPLDLHTLSNREKTNHGMGR